MYLVTINLILIFLLYSTRHQIWDKKDILRKLIILQCASIFIFSTLFLSSKTNIKLIYGIYNMGRTKCRKKFLLCKLTIQMNNICVLLFMLLLQFKCYFSKKKNCNFLIVYSNYGWKRFFKRRIIKGIPIFLCMSIGTSMDWFVGAASA